MRGHLSRGLREADVRCGRGRGTKPRGQWVLDGRGCGGGRVCRWSVSRLLLTPEKPQGQMKASEQNPFISCYGPAHFSFAHTVPAAWHALPGRSSLGILFILQDLGLSGWVLVKCWHCKSLRLDAQRRVSLHDLQQWLVNFLLYTSLVLPLFMST